VGIEPFLNLKMEDKKAWITFIDLLAKGETAIQISRKA
jgi:hypothetical protein